MSDEREFTCEFCGDTFTTTRPEADTQAEYEELFAGAENMDDKAVVCDGCFRWMTGQYAPQDFVFDEHQRRTR